MQIDYLSLIDENPVNLPQLAHKLRCGDKRSLAVRFKDLESVFKAREPHIRAFIPEPGNRFERLRKDWYRLLTAYPDPDERPPLFGVPIGVKDIIHVEGFPTRAGSDLPPEIIGGAEAEVVRTLKKAGAVIMGKTVTVEFANYGPGPTRNPHNLEHTPGGSSSGSAAAVASGLCPLALGTQTVGSVIRPAAYCGVVGFKPTFDRIPTSGVILLAPSLDTVGCFTGDVASAELAASILVDHWQPLERELNPVLGIPNGSYLERADMSALLPFHSICDRFRKAGVKLKSINLFEDFKALEEMHDTICDAEFAGIHTEWFKTYGAQYSAGNSQAILRGQCVSPQRLGIARNNRTILRDHIMKAMQKKRLTALIAPAAPGPAPKGLLSTGDWVMNLPWTHAGLPVVTLPSGLSQEGLPLGLQLIGHHMGDEALLSLAGTIENLLE